MRYALLIFANPRAYEGLSDGQRGAITAEYMALRDEAAVRGGARLQPLAHAQPERRFLQRRLAEL